MEYYKGHSPESAADSIDIERLNKNIENINQDGKKERIDEREFLNISPDYTQEKIDKDMKYVHRAEEVFAQQLEHLGKEEREKVTFGLKRSEAVENIANKCIESYDWLGGNAMTVRSSRFDDIVNGVDLVVEFDTQIREKIALAVDASTSSEYEVIKQKFLRNIERIAGKRPPLKIKYGKSPVDGVMEELESIIPAVIGLESKNANELIMLFGHLLQTRQSLTQDNAAVVLKQIHAELQKHPAQIIIIKEIIIQLETYKKILSPKRDKVSQKYKKEINDLLTLTQDIITSKKDIDLKDFENDAAFQMIKQVCEEMSLV